MRRLLYAFLGYSLLIGSCAIPRPPTGGPPDRTPPRLVSSDPPAGAIHVQTRRIRLTFSEYIDPASFQQALSIHPEPDMPPRIRWKGKTVELIFDRPLREQTTYLITLDTHLKDWHGVPLQTPITLAFSTGAYLYEARLRGQVRFGWSDAPAPAFDVFAYRDIPASLQEALPDYRTQTDPRGNFELAYLPDTTFFVIALNDQNRNRRPDPTEAFAVPPRALLPALRTPTTRDLWYVTRLDTLPPALRIIRPLSNQRLELRFSEPVQLLSLQPKGWTLRTRKGKEILLQALFQPQAPSPVLYVLTEPMPTDSLQLVPTAIADTAGNTLPPVQRTFFPTEIPDTFRTRFLQFLPSNPVARESATLVLSPYSRPGIRFSQPPDTSRFAATLHVRDTSGTAISYRYETRDGRSFYLILSSREAPFELQLDGRLIGEDTLFTQRYRYLTSDEVGNLILPVRYTGTEPLRVTLLALDRGRLPTPLTQSLTSEGAVTFTRLPEGHYRMKVFLDRLPDGRWNGGTIVPYQPPERLIWLPDTLRVRPRWDIVLDTLELNQNP